MLQRRIDIPILSVNTSGYRTHLYRCEPWKQTFTDLHPERKMDQSGSQHMLRSKYVYNSTYEASYSYFLITQTNVWWAKGASPVHDQGCSEKLLSSSYEFRICKSYHKVYLWMRLRGVNPTIQSTYHPLYTATAHSRMIGNDIAISLNRTLVTSATQTQCWFMSRQLLKNWFHLSLYLGPPSRTH